LHPRRREDSGGRESVDRPKSTRMTEVVGCLAPKPFWFRLGRLRAAYVRNLVWQLFIPSVRDAVTIGANHAADCNLVLFS
jgi:hypothetical protein